MSLSTFSAVSFLIIAIYKFKIWYNSCEIIKKFIDNGSITIVQST